MTSKLVVCFCERDFLSEVVIEKILLSGFSVKVCSTEPFCDNSLRIVAKLGQISFHVIDMLNYNAVLHIVHGASYVVNFIPLSHSINASNVRKFSKFVQKSTKNIADASIQAEVLKFVHLSSVVFDINNRYTRSILEAEKTVLSIVTNAIILRFDFIFGENDFLLCKFGKLFSIIPFFPLFGNGQSIVSPIYVGDVSIAILKCITLNTDSSINNGVFELSGINNYTITELYNTIADFLGEKATFIKVPFCFFRIECFFSNMKIFYIFTYMFFGRFESFFHMSEYPLFKNNMKTRKNSISMFVPKPTLLESKIESILTPLRSY